MGSNLGHDIIASEASLLVIYLERAVYIYENEYAAERLQTRKMFPTDFVPQPSWSSDEEAALVSFLLHYSNSHSWTFRRTDVARLGSRPLPRRSVRVLIMRRRQTLQGVAGSLVS